MSSFGLYGHCTPGCTYIHAGKNTHTHKNKFLIKKKKGKEGNMTTEGDTILMQPQVKETCWQPHTVQKVKEHILSYSCLRKQCPIHPVNSFTKL